MKYKDEGRGPLCDDCGAYMTRVKDRRYKKGYRWRCPNCDAA